MLVMAPQIGQPFEIDRAARLVILGVDADGRVRIGVEPPLDTPDGGGGVASLMEPVEGETDQGEMRVLLVEDNPAHARLVTRSLSRCGDIALTTVGTVDDAMKSLLAAMESPGRRPGLVLLDLELPDGSGFSVIKAFKKHAPMRRIPIVVLSSSDDENRIADCLDAGANAFITKNVGSPEQLDRAIACAVGFWRRVQQPVD